MSGLQPSQGVAGPILAGRPDCELALLQPGQSASCASLTFPAYRHLLALEPTQRHPGEGEQRVIQPLGVVARAHDGVPVGLALAECPLVRDQVPEILSVYVRAEVRNRGVATALLGRLEEELSRKGFGEVNAVYMSGKPTIAALERAFAKSGWEAPILRTVTVRFTPEEATRTPWYGRLALSPEHEIFPWTELTAAEREELQTSQARQGWIAAGLEPWRHDAGGFDPVSSVGMRFRGKVVGWVVNHRIAPDAVRFTCSFMRKDLGRRGRILPLYTASIERLRRDGCRLCSLVAPVEYPAMMEFVRNRCAAWVHFVGETRGVAKRLHAAAPGSTAPAPGVPHGPVSS